MAENRYFKILEQVYLLTNNTTPRSFDCGELCGKKCCGSLLTDEHQSGMALLPHEKEFLLSKGADFDYTKNQDGDILICNGNCKRELRPFACRIFPYYICTDDGALSIKKDLRAASVCPLLVNKKARRANIYFLRSIKRAARLLTKEKCFSDELAGISDFVGYLHDFYNKMEY